MIEVPILVAAVLFLSWIKITVQDFRRPYVPLKTCGECEFGPNGRLSYSCQYKFSDGGDMSGYLKKGIDGCRKKR